MYQWVTYTCMDMGKQCFLFQTDYLFEDLARSFCRQEIHLYLTTRCTNSNLMVNTGQQLDTCYAATSVLFRK